MKVAECLKIPFKATLGRLKVDLKSIKCCVRFTFINFNMCLFG